MTRKPADFRVMLFVGGTRTRVENVLPAAYQNVVQRLAGFHAVLIVNLLDVFGTEQANQNQTDHTHDSCKRKGDVETLGAQQNGDYHGSDGLQNIGDWVNLGKHAGEVLTTPVLCGSGNGEI